MILEAAQLASAALGLLAVLFFSLAADALQRRLHAELATLHLSLRKLRLSTLLAELLEVPAETHVQASARDVMAVLVDVRLALPLDLWVRVGVEGLHTGHARHLLLAPALQLL